MTLAQRFPTLFWDTDPATVDPQRHAAYVIERVLEEGTLESVRALFAEYPKERIIDVIRHSRRLSRRTANFWRVYLDIKEPIACLQPRSIPAPSALWA